LLGCRIDLELEFANLGSDDYRVVGARLYRLVEPEQSSGRRLSTQLLRKMQRKSFLVPIVGCPSRVTTQAKNDRIGGLSACRAGNQSDSRKDREQAEDGECA